LYLTGGITARRRQGGQDFYFRAQASAGALYPTEIYTGVFVVKDIKPGIYHFGADHFGLTPIRQENINLYLDDLGLAVHPKRIPAVSFYLSGIFFKSAWKYRARAFRYVLLDTGHVLENLVLALASEKIVFSCHYDFNDDVAGELVGLDTNREAGLVCVHAGVSDSRTSSSTSKPAPLPSDILATGQVSDSEVSYDEIISAYRSGCNPMPPDDSQTEISNDIGVSCDAWDPIGVREPDRDSNPFTWSVTHRRSKRNFIKQPLAKEIFMQLLDLLCRAFGQSGPENRYNCLRLGFITGKIQDMENGFYLLDPEKRQIGLVKSGHFIDSIASVCLDQQWLAHAAVHFLLMTNLREVDTHYGPRGYRYAMLNAGRLGQLIYLGATALGLGCCGIGALYDGEAQKLLGLNPDSALLYLLATGPVRRL
jgi:SagB-type dehydrogenase family enzyme